MGIGRNLLCMVLGLGFACAGLTQVAVAHPGSGTHPPSGHLDHRDLPTCDAGRVLKLVERDASNIGAVPYQHPVTIVSFTHIRQARHVGSQGPGLRERRWCSARAHLEGGGSRTVYYLVEGTTGFAGVTFGVESCMSGRDLWNVNGSDCSSLSIW